MKFKDFFTFILFYIAWIIISGDLSVLSLLLGGILSFILVLLIHNNFTRILSKQIITKFIFFIGYILLLAGEVFIASFRVAYFALHPNLPFESGIVKIPVDFKEETKRFALTILSITITLTPGTLTLDINGDKQELYIHWLHVEADDKEEAREDIIGWFESIIRRLFK